MRTPQTNKYGRVEWERRFLLERFPGGVSVARVRHIVDRYIDGVNLRLRRMDDGDATHFKLTQKVREDGGGARQGLITTMYLNEREFSVLEKLPARMLRKTRHSVPPFGIDVFEGELRGLVLAEAEFNSAQEASALTLPPFVAHEVTDDLRFTGGELVLVGRQELEGWLGQFGILL